MRNLLSLIVSHAVVAAIGFAVGVYTLPILIQPEAPSASALSTVAASAIYTAKFRRDLAGSDALHWGEGEVAISSQAIAHRGKLAPGPDYQLYLSPEFVETEAEFNRLKPGMVHVGAVKTFSDFLVPLPSGVDPAQYSSVIVWCDTFGEFITAARYR